MMKIKHIGTIILLIFASVGCESVLNQPPRDKINVKSFFKTPNDLKLATNDLYTILRGIGVYTDDASSDNIVKRGKSPRLTGSRITPRKRGSGGWNWGPLRRINFVINNYRTVPDSAVREKYSGIARWFRAYFYFKKVKHFGAVPWYSKVLSPNDSALYKPRDSRKLVMDSVLADVNNAIANIPAEKKLYRITKYTALALKSRIGLFEGTFRKYHHLGDYKKYLKACVKASKRLIQSGAYKLYTKGGPDHAYFNLFDRTNQDMAETILAADYEKNLKTNAYAHHMTSITGGSWGLTQSLVNSYLMKDGSRFTDQKGYKTTGFLQTVKNRDPRLCQTTACPGFTVPGQNSPAPIDLDITMTGYRYIKALPPKSQWVAGNTYFDVILFRYGEVLLNYAEAKAELGTLTQADLNISINKLRDRVGMPHLRMSWANAHPDPYLENEYPNVKGPNKGVTLEIRRERRIELVGEGFRWYDLVRWADLKNNIEQPMVGIYFPHLGAFDFTGDGVPDVYVYKGSDSNAPSSATTELNVNTRKLRNPVTGEIGDKSGNILAFNDGKIKIPKAYFDPIPLEDLTLNPNLKQNPGWEK